MTTTKLNYNGIEITTTEKETGYYMVEVNNNTEYFSDCNMAIVHINDHYKAIIEKAQQTLKDNQDFFNIQVLFYKDCIRFLENEEEDIEVDMPVENIEPINEKEFNKGNKYFDTEHTGSLHIYEDHFVISFNLRNSSDELFTSDMSINN